MFELEESLITKDVVSFIVASIDKFHKTFAKTKLNAFQWEDVLAQALVRAHGKHHVQYGGIAGQSGYDMICNGIRISCKSGVEKRKKILDDYVECLSISSYRLTKHKTWEEKVAFMQTDHEDSFFCLNSNHVDCFGSLRCVYTLYVFPETITNLNNVMWKHVPTPTKTQPRGLSTNGVYYTVEASSGQQLWIHVPISMMWKVFSYETVNIESEQPPILPKEKGNFLCLSV